MFSTDTINNAPFITIISRMLHVFANRYVFVWISWEGVNDSQVYQRQIGFHFFIFIVNVIHSSPVPPFTNMV